MNTKEFNKENVIKELSVVHRSMFLLASEYCEDEYNAAVFASVKMLERVINTVSDMPVCVLYSDARKSFNDLLLSAEHRDDSCDCYSHGVRDCIDIINRLAGDSDDQ